MFWLCFLAISAIACQKTDEESVVTKDETTEETATPEPTPEPEPVLVDVYIARESLYASYDNGEYDVLGEDFELTEWGIEYYIEDIQKRARYPSNS